MKNMTFNSDLKLLITAEIYYSAEEQRLILSLQFIKDVMEGH